MSDSKEASYYEIALTNRQVVTVFVILLTCVVAAFFSGVWIGRRETLPTPETRLAVEPGEPQEETGEALGELNFFSTADTPPPPVAAPEPRPETTPAGPAQTAAPTVRDSPPTSSPPPPARPAATSGEAVVVQVFSSSDRSQAERVVDRLRSAGFAALLSPVEVREQTMYRVRIGPFRERGEAERVADKVRRDFKLDTWITSG